MLSLFEQVILQEAVPKKAAQLGMTPEDPPDLTSFDPNKAPEEQDQNNQQQNSDPGDLSAPPDMDPNAGSPEGDPGATPDPGAGADDPSGADPGEEQDPTQDMGGDDNMGDDQEESPPQEDNKPPGADLEQADKELFKDLKPEQIEVRDNELKERYQDLYSIITDTIEKLNKVTKTSYDARMLELSLRQLISLKDIILVAVTKNFKAKTYLENKVELNKLATLFNQITNNIGNIYEARVKRTLKYNKKKLAPGNSGFDTNFTQDLAF